MDDKVSDEKLDKYIREYSDLSERCPGFGFEINLNIGLELKARREEEREKGMNNEAA